MLQEGAPRAKAQAGKIQGTAEAGGRQGPECQVEGSALLGEQWGSPAGSSTGQTVTERGGRDALLSPRDLRALPHPLHWPDQERGPGCTEQPPWVWAAPRGVDLLGWGWRKDEHSSQLIPERLLRLVRPPVSAPHTLPPPPRPRFGSPW